jgi:hypothetical protein
MIRGGGQSGARRCVIPGIQHQSGDSTVNLAPVALIA